MIRTTLLLLAVLVAPAAAGEAGIDVTRDPETGDVTIRVEAPGGIATWESIARGLARARGYDDSALEGLLPEGGARVDGLQGYLLLAGLNHVLAPAVKFGYLSAKTTGGEPVLTVRLGRRALLATRRRFREVLTDIAGRAAGTGAKRSFGLRLDTDWEKAPKERRLVVLIHGLQSAPDRIDAIIPDLHARKFPVGVFHYPNDQGLDDSAELLAAELAKVAAAHPDREVALVTHSMGGLVARAVIEDPGLDPGNVRQLIMAAPPTHGSRLADLAFALEIGEFIADLTQRALAVNFYQRLEDGMGEAGDDLRPGSDFLRRLNARPRHPRVRYSLLLGTKAHLTKEDLVRMRKRVAAEGKKNRFVRFFGPKLDALLSDLTEVVDGKGDGAVSVKRGKLAGVTDVAFFRVRHAKAWDDPKDPGSVALRKAVLERLERK